METTRWNYGIIIDAQGYFVGAVQWEKGTRRPKINKKGAPKLTMLRKPSEIEGAEHNGRWNGKAWQFPSQKFYRVNAKGQLLSQKAQWPDRLEPLAPDEEYVTVAPPQTRGQRPIWNGSEWKVPRRVYLYSEEGELLNVVLECPREDTENVVVPEGVIKRYAPIEEEDDTES